MKIIIVGVRCKMFNVTRQFRTILQKNNYNNSFWEDYIGGFI